MSLSRLIFELPYSKEIDYSEESLKAVDKWLKDSETETEKVPQPREEPAEPRIDLPENREDVSKIVEFGGQEIQANVEYNDEHADFSYGFIADEPAEIRVGELFEIYGSENINLGPYHERNTDNNKNVKVTESGVEPDSKVIMHEQGTTGGNLNLGEMSEGSFRHNTGETSRDPSYDKVVGYLEAGLAERDGEDCTLADTSSVSKVADKLSAAFLASDEDRYMKSSAEGTSITVGYSEER